MDGFDDKLLDFVAAGSDGGASGQIGDVGPPACISLLLDHRVSHRVPLISGWGARAMDDKTDQTKTPKNGV
jgi:hypothetical protein